MNLIGIIITLLITAVSLFIISKLPLGVEIDSFGKAVISAIVFGVLNAIVKPILLILAAPLNFITLGLLVGLTLFIINVIIFGLAARLVEGFRLKWGIWSAIIGAFALTVINSVLSQILVSVGLSR